MRPISTRSIPDPTIMLITKLHHFAFVTFMGNPARSYPEAHMARQGCASNYQRKGLQAHWRHGCVKAGHGPYDSATTVMHSCLLPIGHL